MPKQLNVNLAFTADTSQAKRELLALLQELKKLAVDSLGDSSLGKYTKELLVARDAAVDLRNKLAEATDVNTGKLDLSKFSQSLKNGGMDLKEYQAQLANLGPAGDKAFASVANAILKAELPLKRTSGLLELFKTTLMNTARWQISSSILHGFLGALLTAWYYAQDLNKSLNNILIVTQLSNELMALFAINANKAAHELSASTTTYTDAALIYYQQGLNDEQVKQRTDVTVKLANVTGDSASKVSEQMTAIWNNFDDGTLSLEHYADVLTALGAATASSSDEIAGGMQQFAASASTVGLSYEYAASALATVVATTRQSENVVGNAFKTLFARLEGLNLGETLDDGTTLNKYSAALDKVGISIKDQQGNMKAMDDILDELGAKWGTLAKDQQVALAQTVGGVRQYTQLIALMDNWGEFLKNLSIANKSDGSLQEQADIYADSWQAAQKRVLNSLEEIYHDLIDDKAFIKVLDFIDNIILGIDAIIKGVGGLKGVLSGIGALLLNVFSKELTQGLNNLAYNFNIKGAQKEAIKQKQQAAAAMKSFGAANADEIVGNATNEAYLARGKLMESYLMNYERLTDALRALMQLELDINEAEGKRLISLAEEVSKQEQISRSLERRAAIIASRENKKNPDGPSADDINQMTEDNKLIGLLNLKFKNVENAFKNGTISAKELKIELIAIEKEINKLSKSPGLSDEMTSSFLDTANSIRDAKNAVEGMNGVIKPGTSEYNNVAAALNDVGGAIETVSVNAANVETYLTNGANASKELADAAFNSADAALIDGENIERLAQTTTGVKKATDAATESFNNALVPLKTSSELIVLSALGVSNLVFALKSISGIIDTINNKDMSFAERATAVIGSLAMLVPTLINSYKTLNDVFTLVITKLGAKTAATTAETVAEEINTGAVLKNTAGVLANNAAWYANPIFWVIGAIVAVTVAVSALTAEQEKNTQALKDLAVKVAEVNNKLLELVKTQKEATKLLADFEKAYKETGQASTEFTSYLEELIDVYDIQDGRLLLLLNNYDLLIEKIHNALEAELARARSTAQDAIEADTAILNNEFQSKRVWSMGAQLEDGTAQLDLVREIASYYGLSEDTFKITKNALNEHNYVGLGLILADQFDDVLAAIKEMKAAGIDFSDSYIADLENIINSESYKTLLNDLANDKNLLLQLQLLSNSPTVSSMQEAAKLFSKLNQEGYTYKEIMSEAPMYLGELANNYDLVRSAAFLANVPVEEMAKAYDSLPDEKKKFFGQIDFSKLDSAANLEKAIDELLNLASSLSITLVLTTAQQEAKDFNSSGTLLEKQAWIDNASTFDWGETKAELMQNKLRFLALTAELQEAYIAEHTQNIYKESINGLNNLLDDGVDSFNKYANKTNEELAVIEGQLKLKAGGAAQYARDAESHLEQLGLSDDDVERIKVLAALAQLALEDFYNARDNKNYALEKYNETLAQSHLLQLEYVDGLSSMGEVIDAIEDGTITSADAANYAFEKFRSLIDTDIDESEWEELLGYLLANADQIEDVSDLLMQNDKAAKKVAEDILRFDKAIERVNDSYEDWFKTLKSGTVQDLTKVMKELANTYADVLGLEDSDLFSEQFLSSTENLELMQQALEGSEEAYKQLLQLAAEDILINLNIPKEQFLNDLNWVRSSIEELSGQDFDDIEVGASLNNDAFLQGLTDMVNAAGMTADQATAYLASMGVDAEVTEVNSEADEVKEDVGFDSVWTLDIKHGSVPMYSGSGFNVSAKPLTTDYVAYDLAYQPLKVSETAKKLQKAFSLKVTSAHKSSGGGVKFKNASHGGGGGGSKGGGGGGGGSTPKHTTQQHATKKPPQQTEDRYHVINNQIEDLAKQYDRLSEAEERAFGKSKLALMDQQKKKLEEQYQAQRKLREEAEDYWAKDLANLKSGAFDSDGDDIADTFGIDQYLNDWRKENDKNPIELELDVNGTILNYDELVEGANERYNAEVEAYNTFIEERWNSLSAEEQADEATKEAFEKDKEAWDERIKNEGQYYDNFLSLIKQYEDTQDKVQEELNKEIEAYHAVLNLMLETTQLEIQLRVDLDDYRLETLDFLLLRVADDAFAAAEKIALIGQQTALTADKIDAASDGIAGMFDNHYNKDHVYDNENADYITNQFSELMKANGYESGQDLVDALKSGTANLPELFAALNNEFSEKEVEQFKTYVKDILDGTGELWQQRKDIFDAASEQIEASNDQLDRMADQIDHLNEITGKYKDIMNILGHNGYYEITTDLILEQAKAQQLMYRDSVAAAKERNDFAKETLETAKAQRDQFAEGTEDYRLWDEMVKKAEDRFHETESELMADLEEALQHARDLFDETMQLMAEDASKIMGGAMGSLEGLSNMMDQYEKTHDTFVEGYEQVYRLNKLNAEAAKAIDETNNPKAKRELMKYQQEVLDLMRAYQEEGAQMSEWELQNLEKKLALRQAELALEEARNVKSQVRMQRDNEGNYSYIYTADEDSVADAEANYRDKLYEMQKANAEYIQQLQNDIVSLQQDALQQAQDAALTYGYGTEAYFKALDNINQWYNEAVQDKYNQLEMVMGANQELQQFDAEFHARITGDMMVADNDYITNFNDTIYSQLTGFTSSEQAANQWKETLGGYIGEAKAAINDYKTNNENAMNAAGLTLGASAEDWKKWGEAASGAASGAAKESGNLAEQIKALADAYKKAVNGDEENPGILKDITSWQEKWSAFITDVTGKNTNLATSLGNIIEKLNGVGNAGVEAGKKVKEGMDQANLSGTPAAATDVATPTSTPSGNSGGSGGGGGNDYNEPDDYDKNPVGTGNYKYSSNNDGKSHTTSEKMSDGTWKVINSKASCEWTMTGPTSGYCIKCGQEYSTTKNSTSTSTSGKTIKMLNKGLIQMASGGYTGDWDSTDGKLAVLHEKELVLNKEDTANMLSAISMIRQISSVIDLNAKSASGAFSSLIAAGVNAGAQELQQEVHITAEFPNATDHNEILEAFDNVINLASMYANRKL